VVGVPVVRCHLPGYRERREISHQNRRKQERSRNNEKLHCFQFRSVALVGSSWAAAFSASSKYSTSSRFAYSSTYLGSAASDATSTSGKARNTHTKECCSCNCRAASVL